MSDLHSIGWYAERIAPHLPKQVFKPVPQRLWGGLAYLALTVSSIATIALFDLHPLVYLGISVLVTCGFAGLGFLAHDILHGGVVKKAWLRDFLAAIAFAQFSIGPKLWRKWHNMEHHAHTQMDDDDPDAWASMEEFYKRPVMCWVYRLPAFVRACFSFASFAIFFSLHSTLMLRKYYHQFRPRERRIVLLQWIWPYTMWLTLLAFIGPVKWFFAYLLPLLAANALVIAYISTNHQLNPLVAVNDPLANSLTVTVPRWMNVLHMNFAYHTEHHLFPGVSGKWGPVIQAEIQRQFPDRYHAMPFGQALKALWKTPRIYANRTDLVDPLQGLAYGSLGFGLDPADIRPHSLTPLAVEPGLLVNRLEESRGD